MSESNYEHSETFNSLKGLEETLKGNHTSAQYLEALDGLIDNAVRPVIQSTTLFESFVTQLLGWQENHRKRKVSFLERQEFMQVACAWLIIPSKIERSLQARRLRVERAALLEFLNTFMEVTEPYLKACDGNLVNEYGVALPLDEQLAYIRTFEQSFGAPGNLRPFILEAQHWWLKAQEFKNLILEKYVRLCLVNAQKDYKVIFECRVNLNDIIQAYVLSAIRAIDKCDARQGVLTTHIRNWFLTARSTLYKGMQARQAELPEEAGLDLSATSEAHDLEPEEELESIRMIARLADPEGYGRAYLGLVESTTWIEDNRVTC